MKKPKRYQLKKEAVAILKKDHPWIFSQSLSTATSAFKPGQFLELVDGDNKILGYGYFEDHSAIGIRILSRTSSPPKADYYKELFLKALAKRQNLRKYSNAFRLIHGENDGFPGVVLDVYKDVAVLQTYMPWVNSLGRLVALWAKKELNLKSCLWKPPTRSQSRSHEARWLFGPKVERVAFKEGDVEYHVGFEKAQKSGTFLDLRALRKWIKLQKWKGAQALNLFSYTGMLSLALSKAGAEQVWNVDISQGALDWAKKYHESLHTKYRYLKEDVFEWLHDLSPKVSFDVIIVDPPAMASQISQIPNVMKTYQKIYKQAFSFLRPNGYLVLACCTSRVNRDKLKEMILRIFSKSMKLVAELKPEDDHPVSFEQADYLKIFILKKHA